MLADGRSYHQSSDTTLPSRAAAEPATPPALPAAPSTAPCAAGAGAAAQHTSWTTDTRRAGAHADKNTASANPRLEMPEGEEATEIQIGPHATALQLGQQVIAPVLLCGHWMLLKTKSLKFCQVLTYDWKSSFY